MQALFRARVTVYSEVNLCDRITSCLPTNRPRQEKRLVRVMRAMAM